MECVDCGQLLEKSYKFCFKCGRSIISVCQSCGETIMPNFSFCTACGAKTGSRSRSVDMHWSQTQEVRRTGSPKENLVSDVKARLLQLKSKVSGESGIPTKKTKTVKQDLKYHVGLKEKRGDCYVALRPESGGGVQKVSLDRHKNYNDVLHQLMEVFEIGPSYTGVLLNNQNSPLNPDSFSVEDYTRNYTYIGVTRLYLGIEIKSEVCASQSPPPPVLTPQKGKGVLEHSKPDLETLQQDEVMQPQQNVTPQHQDEMLPDKVDFDQVKTYIKETQTREIQSLEKDCTGFTPIYTNNIAVMRYLDIQEEKGTHIDIVQSNVGGSFALLPNETFPDFLEFRDTFDTENLLFLNPPLMYFLKITQINPINLEIVSKRVVKVTTETYTEYRRWYDLLKNEIG